MAEKVIIFEADIKIDEAVAETARLKEEVTKLHFETEKLKRSQGETSEAYIKSKATLDNANKSLKHHEGIVKTVVAQNNQNTEAVGKFDDVTKNATKRLREINVEMANMAAKGEQNTEKFRQLQQEGGHLRDSLDEVRARIKLYASDTRQLDQAIMVFQGIGAAAQIAEGASALLGNENEELTKSIQKMVAIQSVLNGLQEIQNLLQKESGLMILANSVKMKAMAAAQALYTTAVGTSTGAMKLFRIALLGTGIGAIAVAIGLLISNWDELTGSVNESKKAIDGTRIANDELRDSYNEHIKIIRDLKIEYDLLSGKITDQEAEVQKLKNEYGDALVTIENETSEKLSKAGGYWNNLKLSLKSLGSTYGLLSLQAKQNAEILTEQAVKSAHENEKYLLKKKLADEKAAQDASKLSQKEKDEAEKKRKDELAAYEKYLNEKYQKDVDYYVAKANEDINRQYQEQESEAIQQQAISDMLKAERQKRREQKDIDRQLELESKAVDFENELILLEQYGASEIEIQKIKLEQQRKEEVANAERIGADVTLINEKYRQYDLELQRMNVDAKLALASNFMSGISQLFDQGTAIGKAAAVAETVINTYRGAQAAFADTHGHIAIRIAAAGLATAIGLKNVKKILATKKGSTGSAGSETASAPIANAVNPSVSMGAVSGAVGTSTGQMVTNAVDSSAKTQIAVVVDDVTAKQNQKTNANKLATL